MILTCPECGTQYVVKEGAIPPAGRQVRCASCKHSWHQDPEETPTASDHVELASTPEVAAAPQHPAPEEFDQAELHEPVEPAPHIEPPGYTPLMTAPEPVEHYGEDAVDVADPVSPNEETDWPAETAASDDEFAPFGPRDYVDEPRRKVLPIVLAVLLIVAAAVAFWFLAPPEWKTRLGIAQADETPLQLMLTHNDWQPLASGNKLLTVTGRVINPTDHVQSVPPIRAELRKSTGELVYSWTIDPPAADLGPGAVAPFNSAEVNVPSGGDQLTLTLGNPRA
ncbi:MAG: MJ0042-type zinc finger domain-containing protein [Sphingomicrobium sp.]